jgi:hypothetical protein
MWTLSHISQTLIGALPPTLAIAFLLKASEWFKAYRARQRKVSVSANVAL